MKNVIEIYTDGGLMDNKVNNYPGAYAFVVLHNGQHIHEAVEIDAKATNNRMELKAIISSLNFIIDNDVNYDNITLYSDSEYCIKGINTWMHNWKSKNWLDEYYMERPNVDLWKEIYSLYNKIDNIKYQWIKGHNGIEWNEHVDMLCTNELYNFKIKEKERGIKDEKFNVKELVNIKVLPQLSGFIYNSKVQRTGNKIKIITNYDCNKEQLNKINNFNTNPNYSDYQILRKAHDLVFAN